MRFQHRDGLWWGEADGMVQFYAWEGPGNAGGFGGSVYKLPMADGTIAELLGPWSSRPGVMHQAGFPACMEVEWAVDDNYAYGHMLVDVIKASGLVALEQLTDSDQFVVDGVIHASHCKTHVMSACGLQRPKGTSWPYRNVDCMACIASDLSMRGESTWHAVGP